MPTTRKARATERRRQAALIAAALLLLYEHRGLWSMRTALAATVAHMSAIGASAAVTEAAIVKVQAGVILRLRRAARMESARMWERQTGMVARAAQAARLDETAARAAAKSLAHRWRQMADTKTPDAQGVYRTPSYSEAAESAHARARVIAATENASAWNAEHERLARDAVARGLAVSFTWEAEGDRSTCGECADLDGTTVSNIDDFPQGMPPLHPQCCPPGTMVDTPSGKRPIESLCVGDEVSGGLTGLPRRVDNIYASKYAGILVQVTDALGHKLRLTPNHPVLTQRGWIEAGLLVPSDALFHHVPKARHSFAETGSAEAENAPTARHQVVGLPGVDGQLFRCHVPVAGVHFDCVAPVYECDIDVPRMHGMLRNYGQSARPEGGNESRLDGSGMCQAHPVLCGDDLVGLRSSCPQNRSVGGASEALPTRDPFARHPQHVRFAGVPGGDANTPHVLGDREAANPQLVAHGEDRLHFDKMESLEQPIIPNKARSHHCNLMPVSHVAIAITSIVCEPYDGDVFNFSVESDESYVANEIVVHNCRCVVTTTIESSAFAA